MPNLILVVCEGSGGLFWSDNLFLGFGLFFRFLLSAMRCYNFVIQSIYDYTLV